MQIGPIEMFELNKSIPEILNFLTRFNAQIYLKDVK